MHVRNLVNLTGRRLVIRLESGEEVELPPDPRGPARVCTSERVYGREPIVYDGIEIPVVGVITRIIEIANLPPPRTGTIYVVPRDVLAAIHGRYDVVASCIVRSLVTRTMARERERCRKPGRCSE